MSTKTERQAQIAAERSRHHAALNKLHAKPESAAADGLKIWRAVRRLESVAHGHATAYCNGETATIYPRKGEPIRCDYRHDSEHAWYTLRQFVEIEIKKIFGCTPTGFFVNGDARGYALKIDGERGEIPHGMHRDFGGYGILAAIIE
jgi:hypothetical protein